ADARRRVHHSRKHATAANLPGDAERPEISGARRSFFAGGVYGGVVFAEGFHDGHHVIAALDTEGMEGNCFQRKPYPVTWALMHGKGRVFYTAMGDRPENWQIPFFLNLLGGGIRFALGDANATLTQNIGTATPGYGEIPPREPEKKS